MEAEKFVSAYKAASLKALEALPEAQVSDLVRLLGDARRDSRQIFLCGNGGSAAMASHMAGELGKDASMGKPRRFRALSLTDNVAWMTALANDTAYDRIFVEQLKNFAAARDLLIAFSCSGNSPNVVAAVEWANSAGLITVGVTGQPGGKLARLAGRVIQVPSGHVGRIQEGHFLIQHLVCYFFIEDS